MDDSSVVGIIVGIIAAIIALIIFFVLIRKISRKLYNKGKTGYVIHNVITLVGSIITLIISLVITFTSNDNVIIGCVIVYAVLLFLTVYWWYSSSEDHFVTEHHDEIRGTIDYDTGTVDAKHYKYDTTYNSYSLKEVLLGSLLVTAIATVITAVLSGTSFAWIPSAFIVGVAVFLTLRAIKE